MSIRRSAINRNATEEEGGPIQSPSVLNLTQPELYGIYNNDENISKEFVEDSSEIEKIKTRDLNHGAKGNSNTKDGTLIDKDNNLFIVLIFGILFCIFIYRKFI